MQLCQWNMCYILGWYREILKIRKLSFPCSGKASAFPMGLFGATELRSITEMERKKDRNQCHMQVPPILSPSCPILPPPLPSSSLRTPLYFPFFPLLSPIPTHLVLADGVFSASKCIQPPVILLVVSLHLPAEVCSASIGRQSFRSLKCHCLLE